jgi:hypothetical protein
MNKLSGEPNDDARATCLLIGSFAAVLSSVWMWAILKVLFGI